MVDFLKRTYYKAGGLLVAKPDLTLATSVSTEGMQAPVYIDNRSLLLTADDQGQTSQCAAYSMATVIEVAKWKQGRMRKTIDPGPIYAEAKRIDGDDNEGTYLDSVFKASKNLGLIGPGSTMRALKTRNDVKFAIREHEVCLLGFMISDGWNEVNRRTGYIGLGRDKLGGHAVAGCWYNDIAGARDIGIGWGNSWSPSWGVNGFGRMTWAQFEEQFMYGLVVENI